MSGIVGVLGVEGATPDGSLLQALTQFMAFRGPGAQHTWVGEGIGLGHALLNTWSIPNEQQPLSLDGKTWIVADARLDARTDLLSAVHRAGESCSAGVSDAELILRAYAAWGQGCLERLLGDFCFAIWDADKKSLFCGHDQLGIRPFYYAETPRWLVFGNTLDCLRLQTDSAALNELSVADFLLFGSIQDPAATMFAGVRRLPPAHALTWREGILSVRRYWTFPEDQEIQYQNSGDYEEHFRDMLFAAVKDRLRPGRVAIAMSGGLDSPSVAAMACRAGCDLRAFTTVYDRVIPHEERHYSQLTAGSLGISIEHLPADEYVEAVQKDVSQKRSSPPDEDVLAAYETDFNRQVASTSRILLTGHGGDIGLHPANSHFRRLLRAGHVGRFLRDGVQYAMAERGLPPMGFRTFLQRRLRASDSWFGDYPGWLNPNFERRLRLRERWRENSVRLPKAPHRTRPESCALLQDPIWQNYFESSDPGNSRLCLHHVHPYFDLRLLRFLFSISPVPWMWNKSLLRSAMRDLLPEAVRLRPKTPLPGDPWLIFVRRNREKFLRAPLNLTAYVDRVKHRAFLDSPEAFGPNGYPRSVRPAVLSAWLDGVAA